jgi:prepilin peptidase CpaA
MSTYALLMSLPALAMLVCAAVIDWRSRRIPNWITYSLLLAGIAQSAAFGAICSPGNSLLGILVGGALPCVLFAMGALGAGDVKLLAGLGAWFGPQAAVAIFIAETLVGMVMVLIQAASQGRLRVLFRNTAVLAVNLTHIGDVGLDHAKATGQSCRSVDRPLPYAVPVLIVVAILLSSSWTPWK